MVPGSNGRILSNRQSRALAGQMGGDTHIVNFNAPVATEYVADQVVARHRALRQRDLMASPAMSSS